MLIKWSSQVTWGNPSAFTYLMGYFLCWLIRLHFVHVWRLRNLNWEYSFFKNILINLHSFCCWRITAKTKCGSYFKMIELLVSGAFFQDKNNLIKIRGTSSHDWTLKVRANKRFTGKEALNNLSFRLWVTLTIMDDF